MIGAGIFTTAIVVTGLIFLGAPTAEGKQRSDGKIPEVTDEKSAEPASSELDQEQPKKQRMGKRPTDETKRREKTKAGSGTAKGSEEGPAGKRSEIGSGGGGVTGAVGR